MLIPFLLLPLLARSPSPKTSIYPVSVAPPDDTCLRPALALGTNLGLLQNFAWKAAHPRRQLEHSPHPPHSNVAEDKRGSHPQPSCTTTRLLHSIYTSCSTTILPTQGQLSAGHKYLAVRRSNQEPRANSERSCKTVVRWFIQEILQFTNFAKLWRWEKCNKWVSCMNKKLHFT